MPSESAFDYFEATKNYLRRHGRPVAFYSDKHSIFRKSNKDDKEFRGDTQFGRVLRELNIDIICANTPQAKGRVERANSTLQDRLVKELRLAGIDNMDDATMAECVRLTRERRPGVILEASGNIPPERIAAIRDLGLDVVSAGGLIHQARWVDLSLRLRG